MPIRSILLVQPRQLDYHRQAATSGSRQSGVAAVGTCGPEGPQQTPRALQKTRAHPVQSHRLGPSGIHRREEKYRDGLFRIKDA